MPESLSVSSSCSVSACSIDMVLICPKVWSAAKSAKLVFSSLSGLAAYLSIMFLTEIFVSFSSRAYSWYKGNTSDILASLVFVNKQYMFGYIF